MTCSAGTGRSRAVAIVSLLAVVVPGCPSGNSMGNGGTLDTGTGTGGSCADPGVCKQFELCHDVEIAGFGAANCPGPSVAGEWRCILLAFRNSTPGHVGIDAGEIQDDVTSCGYIESIEILGDGTAIVRRFLGATDFFSRRVEIRAPDFFDRCLASDGAPEDVLPCLGDWFEPESCLQDACCAIPGEDSEPPCLADPSRECAIPLASDGWCEAPRICERPSGAGCVDCCMGVDCCDSATGTVGFVDYDCVLGALRDSTVSELNVQINFPGLSGRELIDNRIVVLGDGRAELRRARAYTGEPGQVEAAIVQIKPQTFFDACLAPGMPEADPCAAIDCLLHWYEPNTCDPSTCCLEPTQGTGLLCP